MEDPNTEPGLRIRPVRRKDVGPILKLDAAAFDPFWRFDAKALVETSRATPQDRRRAAQQGGRVIGYAMTGRSGATGFIQRLAVDPGHHRKGTGRALLADGLRWLERRGAVRVLVNTQPGNSRAQALYRSTGFVPQPEDLAVLHFDQVAVPRNDHR